MRRPPENYARRMAPWVLGVIREWASAPKESLGLAYGSSNLWRYISFSLALSYFFLWFLMIQHREEGRMERKASFLRDAQGCNRR